MIIYCATNLLNSKKYVGQTVQVMEKRKRQHLGDAKKGFKNPFYNAIRKYGEENFTWEILCTADDIEELNAREEYFIAAYGTLAYKGKGYNLMAGGGNKRHSGTSKQRISKALKGKKRSPEHCTKISEARKGKYTGEKHPMFGKKRSPEHCAKISAAKKGAWAGEKNPMFGKKPFGEKNPRYDKTIYTFTHAMHGIEKCTQYDLRIKYGCNPSHLSALLHGKLNHHAGWRLAGNI